MNDELSEVQRIEREVAAELDLLAAILGVDPALDPADVVAGPSDESPLTGTGTDTGTDTDTGTGSGTEDEVAAAPGGGADDEPVDGAPVRALGVTDADAALLAAILATDRGERAPAGDRTVVVRRPGVLRSRRWWYGAAAAAAVTLGLGGALALRPSAPATADQPAMLRFAGGSAFTLLDADATDALPSAHDTLLALGDAAAATTDPAVGGDVQYVQFSAWFSSRSDDEVVLEPVQRDSWLAPDGSVRAEEARYGAFDPWGDLVQPSIPPGVQTAVDEIPAGSFDASLVVDASTDPALVLPELVRGGCDVAQLSCTTSHVENTFMQYVVPSDTRAAIWRALAARTDLRLMGDVTDRLGRHGVGIGFREPVEGWAAGGVFIVDPGTGELLGVERVLHMPDEPAMLAEVTAIQRSEWVAAVGDKP